MCSVFRVDDNLEDVIDKLSQLKGLMSIIERLSLDLDFRLELNEVIEDSEYANDYFESKVLGKLDAVLKLFNQKVKEAKTLSTETEKSLLLWYLKNKSE